MQEYVAYNNVADGGPDKPWATAAFRCPAVVITAMLVGKPGLIMGRKMHRGWARPFFIPLSLPLPPSPSLSLPHPLPAWYV
jgi:hypothetical protein